MNEDKPGLARHTDPSTSHEAAEETDATRLEHEIYQILKGLAGNGRWYSAHDLAKDKGGITDILYDTLTPRMPALREMLFVECVIMPGNNYNGRIRKIQHYRIRTWTMTFDLGTRIKQVRAAEAKLKAEEAALEAKQKPLKDWAAAARVEILQFLNDTKQKSANTEYGTAYWKPKVTYRVEDKDEFRRHVIGMEEWELVTWGAAGNAAEAFTNEHGEPPPGCVRNSVNLLYITAPAKPRTKVTKASEGSMEAEQAELEEANPQE